MSCVSIFFVLGVYFDPMYWIYSMNSWNTSYINMQQKRDTKSLHFSMMIYEISRAKEELLCFMSDINIDMV